MSSEKNIDIKLTEYNEINGKNKYYFGEIKATPTKLWLYNIIINYKYK